MKYQLPEMRKLIALSLIVLAVAITFFKISFWAGMFIVGAGLMIEHLIVYGKFKFLDILGHEWAGLILVVIPLIVFEVWTALGLVVIAFLIACNYQWEDELNPLQYAISKITGFFND